MEYFLIILLGCALGISIIEDLRRMKIPNLVTYPTMILAIGYHTFTGGWNGLAFSAGGMLLGTVIFIIPYILGGMGAGDAKLMGAAGAILGPKGIFIASILVVLAGGIYGLILFALHPKYFISFLKRWKITFITFFRTFKFLPIPPDKNLKQPVLRFALPIAIGTIFYVYLDITGNSFFSGSFGV